MTTQIPAEELRTVLSADVYKNGRRAGTLVRDKDATEFAYAEEYLAATDSPAVAFTLPKTDEPVRASAGSVPPFFAGMLPEGARLRAMTSATRTSEDDQLTLLLAVGQDTIGDVTVLPSGQEPSEPDAIVADTDIADADLEELFARAVSPSSTRIDRVALPGVQVKVSANVMSTPLATTAGPGILKLAPAEYPQLVENEAFFLAMAKAAGLRVPTFRVVHDRNGRTGLLVTRFDRIVTNTGPVRRLAQEDVCQILGRYPAAKYRITLQEAITACGDAVATGGGSAALTIREALEIAIVSYVIGNGDLHGKNLSVLQTGDGIWELTPAYDLLTTQPYLSWRDPMALPLFGRANRLTRKWWLEDAARLGITEQAIARRLDRIADTAASWADRVSEIGFEEKTSKRLAQLLIRRSAELRS